MPKVSEEHRAERRAHIVEAAMRRVAVDGYHKMTMADVIAESGLSAGAVYGYFASKRDLICTIALHVSDLARNAIDLTRAQDPVPDVPDALHLLISTLTKHLDTGPTDLGRVVVSTWAEAARDPEVHAILRAEFTEVRSRFVALLDRIQGAGHLEPGVDTTAAATTLVGLMPGFLLQRLILGDVDAQSYSSGLRALCSSGISTA